MTPANNDRPTLPPSAADEKSDAFASYLAGLAAVDRVRARGESALIRSLAEASAFLAANP